MYLRRNNWQNNDVRYMPAMINNRPSFRGAVVCLSHSVQHAEVVLYIER